MEKLFVPFTGWDYCEAARVARSLPVGATRTDVFRAAYHAIPVGDRCDSRLKNYRHRFATIVLSRHKMIRSWARHG